ncbi:MAG: class I SAM-dependent methyltransferase, partial [bacterium]|nr:class I SAM-dependent methyltransferase [bacterium]
IISLFVVDLLSEDAIAAFLSTAYRLLAPGGRLCIGGLAEGEAGLPRAISTLLKRLHAMNPALLGGCRPLAIGEYLDPRDWRVLHRERLCAYGLCSEVVIADAAARS